DLFTRFLFYRFQNGLFLASSRKVNGTFDQRQMGIGLRKIPQKTFSLEIDILTKKSQMVAVRKQFLKVLQSFLFLTNFEQTIDKPKRTHRKRRGWETKIVLVFV